MNRQLIVGMPNSGKSTFIAALRHLLVADEVETTLMLNGLAAEEEHLNRLEREWLNLKPVQRTKPSTEGWVELNIKNRETDELSSLLIPDLRGEAFEQPACAGQCSPDLYSALIDASGLLLFTNADRADDALQIDDLQDILPSADAAAGDAPQASPFIPEDMPEEVKIVELLQAINRDRKSARRRKVAIIVSAWDVVSSNDSRTSPQEWFIKNRPMLAQFLETNEDKWALRVYGVSAQGGRLPQDQKKLASMTPSERVIVVGHGAAVHDLSAPLHWLMFEHA